MNRNKLIALAALAIFATACSKDSTGRIRIMAESMGGNAKVTVDTQNIMSGSSWVMNELININGDVYPIVKVEDEDKFELNVSGHAPSGTLYAVYPATTQVSGGNDIVVTNGLGADETKITINRLVVKYIDADHLKHQTIFPMARKASEGSSVLLFQHLTAGLKFTLKTRSNDDAKTETEPVNVASVKVVVQGSSAAAPLVIDDVTYRTSWAVQGPTTPAGNVGSITGNRPVAYCSEMNFDMEEPGHDYVTVDNGGIVFCVPVTLSDVMRLTVTGYGVDGSQLFVQTKNMTPDGEGNYVTLTRNMIYNIPVISF